MQDAKPSRSRGIGFIIVCIVIVGAALYLNAGFNGKIAELRDELDDRFKALSEETTGVKPEIQTNLGALKRLEDGVVSLESRIKSIFAYATQIHDTLYQQIEAQDKRNETLKELVETSRALQAQINALLHDAQGRQGQAVE